MAASIALTSRRNRQSEVKPRMKTLIETYRSRPGEHCGSVAMRSLLEHYCGLELPEDAVFGLGAGLDCVLVSGPTLNPSVLVFGRTTSMEADVGLSLGLDYREQSEADDAEAWELVRKEVLAGRPTMLSGDIFYLDYREYTVHFPGHAFVLVGFDDATETAWIADRLRPEPEACSYAALFASRNPPEGISTQNLWGRFHGTEMKRSVPEAIRFAIDLCAQRMLGELSPDQGELKTFGEVEVCKGIAGIRRLADDLQSWASRDDLAWVASYNARCIEKFGNGGGNFRRLYSGFLRWAREIDPACVPEFAPELAWKAADDWTALSAMLASASKGDATADLWRDAQVITGRIADTEERLFESLAEGASTG